MPDRERAIAQLQEAVGAKYEVLQWIGGGGMAQVYLARHRVTGGLFAVKVLAEHLAHDETIVRRFLEEARTAATLSGHPNVVSIFDIGQQAGLHFLVMQFIDGEDLSAILKERGKLPYAEAARIVTQVAEALVWANARQVVHRDLKPSNVRIDRSGRAVVLDFGIAKAGDVPSGLTAVGDRVGTPYYMSPEHFREGVCDHRSDLYALGVMFFELLTGKRPFAGDSVRAIESAHLFTAPRSPLEADPGVPPEYARIVVRLMQKRPEDRYQNASELLRDLRAEGSPAPPQTPQLQPEMRVPEPPPAPPVEPAPQRPKSRWAPVVIGSCTILLAVLALLYVRHGAGSGQANASAESIQTPAGEMRLVNASPPFYIDAAEVTNTAYKAYCDQTGAPYPPGPASDPEYFFTKPDSPVVNVSWKEAEAFAKWAEKRLPTEQEWDQAGIAESGDVWDWTATVYTPSAADMAGLRSVHAEPPAGEWRVIKGGSPVSRAGFPETVRPAKPAIGIRCVRDAQ